MNFETLMKVNPTTISRCWWSKSQIHAMWCWWMWIPSLRMLQKLVEIWSPSLDTSDVNFRSRSLDVDGVLYNKWHQWVGCMMLLSLLWLSFERLRTCVVMLYLMFISIRQLLPTQPNPKKFIWFRLGWPLHLELIGFIVSLDTLGWSIIFL